MICYLVQKELRISSNLFQIWGLFYFIVECLLIYSQCLCCIIQCVARSKLDIRVCQCGTVSIVLCHWSFIAYWFLPPPLSVSFSLLPWHHSLVSVSAVDNLAGSFLLAVQLSLWYFVWFVWSVGSCRNIQPPCSFMRKPAPWSTRVSFNSLFLFPHLACESSLRYSASLL